MARKRISTLFTSTESMDAAKRKAKEAGFSIFGSKEVYWSNFPGFVVYGRPSKRRK